MFSNYIFVGLIWIIYCVLHSILAATSVKAFLKRKTGNLFRYYRLAYSVFATLTLLLVLYFQYSFRSQVLIDSLFLKYFFLFSFVLPGFIIMMASVFKYFKLLSGVRSLYQATPPNELKQDGIHKYVRHPLYLGTLLFIWGLFFLFPLVSNLIAVVIITIYVLIGIRFEEQKLLREFGNVYAAYIKQVPPLIPRLFKR